MQYIIFCVGIAIVATLLIVSKGRLKYKDFKSKIGIFIITAILCSLALEIFVFNFQVFAIKGKDATKSTSYISCDGTSDNPNIKIQQSKASELIQYVIDVENINSVVNDVDIIPKGLYTTANCTIAYTDDAMSRLIQTSSEAETIAKNVDGSSHFVMHLAGKAHSLRFTISTDSTSQIQGFNINLNHNKAFDLELLRVLICFLVIFLILFFKETYKTEFNIKSTKQMTVILLIVVLQIVSLYSFEKNSNDFEYNGIPTVYQELTLALADGKVDLNGVNCTSPEQEKQQIEQVQSLKNPYECIQRENLDYKWDRALYDGKYYCYFGIVPVVLVYLPVYLLTGNLISNVTVTFIFEAMIIIAIALLVLELARRMKKKTGFWSVVCGIVSFQFCSMILFCINGSNFYEIATLSALFFSILGISLTLSSFRNKDSINNIALGFGALCMALSVGCRPNFALASFIIVPIFLSGLMRNKKEINTQKGNIKYYLTGIFNKQNISAITVFVIPYIIIGVGLMAYNYVRFDSILEFGAKYQLTVYDTSFYKATAIGKMPIALYKGLFGLPEISSAFPFINPSIQSDNYLGYNYSLCFMGVFAYPIMLVLSGFVWSFKRGMKENGLRAFGLISLILGFVMCYLTTALGGASVRYSEDFAWIFCIPLVLIILDLFTRAKNKGILKYVMTIIAILTLATAVIGVLMCFSPTWTKISDYSPEVFYKFKEMILFWR